MKPRSAGRLCMTSLKALCGLLDSTPVEGQIAFFKKQAADFAAEGREHGQRRRGEGG
jgi:hypothetical protein